jgi:hypothetical protein
VHYEKGPLRAGDAVNKRVTRKGKETLLIGIAEHRAGDLVWVTWGNTGEEPTIERVDLVGRGHPSA